jgi:ABC-type transport system involved in cytochrome c biogenesis permease subunit
MNTTSSKLSWCFIGTVGLSLAAYLLMAAAGRGQVAGGFDFETAGRLPIVDHGRVKPIDSLARIALMILSGKQDYRDKDGVTHPATKWLLDVMTAQLQRPEKDGSPIRGDSRSVKAYRIEDPSVRQMLNLKDDGTIYSFQEIYDAAGTDRLKMLLKAAGDLRGRHADVNNPQELIAALNPSDRAMFELSGQIFNHLQLSQYETSHRVFRIDNMGVLAVLGLEERPGFRYGFDEFLPRLAELEREARRAEKVKDRDRSLFDRKAMETYSHVDLYVGLAGWDAKTLLPIAPSTKGGDFKTIKMAEELMGKAENREQLRALTPPLLTILDVYARGNKKDFNTAVAAHESDLQKILPTETAKATTEASFNAFAPFYVCTVFYVILFVVICVSWLWQETAINRFAFWMTVLTACVHTWALVMRMYIQGRPPVTNLYSSAVFIGWVCVLVTLVVERIYRNGIPLAVGTITGALTLFIAHYLGGSGDTLEMLEAVLDTNFWLATHVTSVTIGYSATFVAGFFGIVTIVHVLIDSVRKVPPSYASMKLLGQCIYGVVCFAMLFSFLGTVLGGIWADASWGRFWGWDPKENGALLIVIMNAMILHARWAGMVKVRGMAILSLVGNMVTIWSWFGTNQLGIGLHAYGFNSTLAMVCTWFWLGHLALIGVALLPLAAWNPKYVPLTRTPDAAPPSAPVGKKGRRGQIVPGGAT